MIIRLSESIAHIEDLSVDEFIDVLRNMPTLTAQEKLDGAQLWIGFDDEWKFFTSREGKRSNTDRRYSEADWPKIGAFDQFRAAHLALEQRQNEMKHVLRAGDIVEVEVLYGAQPNSVIYGADGLSYIAFLRGVSETPDASVAQLSRLLNNQIVEVTFDAVDTNDGVELNLTPTNVKFKFTAPQQISLEMLNSASVTKELNKLESFLQDMSTIEGYSNKELATISLTSVPKEKRESVKSARDDVLSRIHMDFKLPIKQALLDKLVRHLKSSMADSENDDIGIEGVVLRDTKNGRQVKIVDKDVFSIINKFNQAVRGEVRSALNTTDPEAPLENRGGLIGELRIKIAGALGNREFAKPSNLRKALIPIKGESPEEAIKNFAKSLNIEDFHAIKRKILAMTAETARQLSEKLQFFKDNRENYRLKLKNGKEMGLSDETVKKTLVSFAETRRNITIMFDKLKATKNLAQLLAILYGSQAKVVHAASVNEVVAEELLLEKKGELDISTYEDKDLFELLNTYLTTVMMAMVIYHTNDTIGMRRLRDRKNYTLKKHENDMSPLNHWGYAVWKCTKPEVKKHLQPGTQKKLALIVKDIPHTWQKFLHMDFSFDRHVNIDWDDHKKTLARLIELSGLRNERLNTMLDMSVRFSDLELAGQRKLIKMLNAAAHRFVPRSSLYVRTKLIAEKLKDKRVPMVTEGLLKRVVALAENESEVSAGAPSATITSTSAVENIPVRLLDTRRRSETRKRNPAVKELTKKFPDPRKKVPGE